MASSAMVPCRHFGPIIETQRRRLATGKEINMLTIFVAAAEAIIHRRRMVSDTAASAILTSQLALRKNLKRLQFQKR
ncbi:MULTISPECIES: hypothetical protein [unclassified Mesorhizobium]|uniref:hypothetical protein n=1 Tax=unclassified Mesorhizobium TaxID=325217 RepID=UPI000FC9FC9E|nr:MULTISPECIES: hypothetical protein [unclassified Mesorhizobium]RUW33643.1 hypothetical protein EOA38_12425 [Mesorhizobium sp. M1E.F.Ca.ET.041.01.1.1]RWD85729.1 MAG: hypothetical protein EOS38_22070 [Mesorhizobium sp.]RWD91501.1 MAG: hypothetical protein EOS39_17570 [Mesorhizobium sp.]TIV46177.1 MAG: hypothetical protein E5V88_32980 [Mesorhizobium sp.]